MLPKIILASGSQIRRTLLENAGVQLEVFPAKIDEDAIKSSLILEQASPRDIADTLAEYKARKVSARLPTGVVIGSDQILDLKGVIFSKPQSKDDAIMQLKTLRTNTHHLHSSAVIYQDQKPVWRFVGKARMTMRDYSDDYLKNYVDRNWNEIQYCVGGYQLESEGSRLFQQVSGDYFTVLGFPLIEVLAFLSAKGLIDG